MTSAPMLSVSSIESHLVEQGAELDGETTERLESRNLRNRTVVVPGGWQGEPAAIKLIFLDGLENAASRRSRFLSAIDGLLALRHDALPRVLAAGTAAANCCYVVTQWIDENENGDGQGARGTADRLLAVVSALEHLHDNGIVHHRLAFDNVEFLRDRTLLWGLGTGLIEPGGAGPCAAPELIDLAAARWSHWRADAYSLARVICERFEVSVSESEAGLALDPGSRSLSLELLRVLERSLHQLPRRRGTSLRALARSLELQAERGSGPLTSREEAKGISEEPELVAEPLEAVPESTVVEQGAEEARAIEPDRVADAARQDAVADARRESGDEEGLSELTVSASPSVETAPESVEETSRAAPAEEAVPVVVAEVVVESEETWLSDHRVSDDRDPMTRPVRLEPKVDWYEFVAPEDDALAVVPEGEDLHAADARAQAPQEVHRALVKPVVSRPVEERVPPMRRPSRQGTFWIAFTVLTALLAVSLFFL